MIMQSVSQSVGWSACGDARQWVSFTSSRHRLLSGQSSRCLYASGISPQTGGWYSRGTRTSCAC